MMTAPLDSPLPVALVGAGNRSRTVYLPLFPALAPWVRVVAVCDPVREHADAAAAALGVPAFYTARDLVAAGPMEAALVVTPIEGHHALSCYLSSHGVHNLVETTMANLLAQARQMATTAREHGVVMRVAENFFRFPFDRIAKKIAQSGAIGEVGRLTCFHDHLGYHNNSRWIVFMGGYPESVQAVKHTMPTLPYDEAPHRHHESETFQARFFAFPGNRLVSDIAGNIKGMLGRYPRPGYTEIDGTRGAIARTAVRNWWGEAEVRICSDAALTSGAIADGVLPDRPRSRGRVLVAGVRRPAGGPGGVGQPLLTAARSGAGSRLPPPRLLRRRRDGPHRRLRASDPRRGGVRVHGRRRGVGDDDGGRSARIGAARRRAGGAAADRRAGVGASGPRPVAGETRGRSARRRGGDGDEFPAPVSDPAHGLAQAATAEGVMPTRSRSRAKPATTSRDSGSMGGRTIGDETRPSRYTAAFMR